MNAYTSSPSANGQRHVVAPSDRGSRATRLAASAARVASLVFIATAAVCIIAGCASTPSNPSNPYSPDHAIGDNELPSTFDCSEGTATQVVTLTDSSSICSTLDYINGFLLDQSLGAVVGPLRLSGTKLYFRYAADWLNRHEQFVMVDVYIDALDVATLGSPGVLALPDRSYLQLPRDARLTVVDPNVAFNDFNQDTSDFYMPPPSQISLSFPVNGDQNTARDLVRAFNHLFSLLEGQNATQYQALLRERRSEELSAQAQQSDASGAADQPLPDSTGAPESASDWQQEHREKIDELKQQIAAHEEQAQQDDAYAEQAEAQVQQDQSANASGPGAGWLALGHAVQGAANAGLAVKMRRDAENERRQAQEEREQLAELGAEQPPVAQNNSESMALTRMQTQMIRRGNTIQGALNQQEDNLQAVQQAAREQSERSRDAQSSESHPGGAVPQVPPTGAVTVTFRGLRSPYPGRAIVTDSVNHQQCPPDCSFTFPPGAYSVHFYAQADANSIFRSFEGNCVWGGGTAPRTPGNSGGCSLGNPSLATTITVYVDPADTAIAGGSAGGGASNSDGSGAARESGGANGGSNGYALRCRASGCVPALSASCVVQFNDPRYYNWISLRNECGQPIDLQFSRIGIGGAGQGTLAPGASVNTGFADNEAPNGMTIAVCPAGYVAWSTRTDGIWMGNGGFVCLRNP